MSAGGAAGPERCHRWIEVFPGRLTANARALAERVGPGRRLLAVIKSDAYGHGAAVTARALAAGGVGGFAVFLIEEAEALRAADVREPVLLLGPIPPGRAGDAVDAGAVPTVHSHESARALADEAGHRGATLPFHLKVDTGMGRMGIPAAELPEFLAAFPAGGAIRMEGLYSHLACAGDPDHPLNAQQLDRFTRALASVRASGHGPATIHLANSGAVLAASPEGFDTVRPGLAVFGYSPDPAAVPAEDLRPALALRARVVQRKTVRRGASVGYGATWTAGRDSVIATVPVGYEEGYPRSLGNRAAMLVRGRRVPVVGRVNMNLSTLDVTGVPGVEVGDVVTALGEDEAESIDAWELANHAGLIVWEILCGLDRTLPRIARADHATEGGR